MRLAAYEQAHHDPEGLLFRGIKQSEPQQGALVPQTHDTYKLMHTWDWTASPDIAVPRPCDHENCSVCRPSQPAHQPAA